MSDNLQDMLRAQLKLQVESFNNDPSNLTAEGQVEWVRWNTLALTDELHEALAETGWKPWATSRHINRDAFVGELVDAFHFFMNLMLVVDCDAEELAEGYFKKHKLNADRQAAGYDGIKGKCGICKRALDDPAVSCNESMCSQI